MKTVIRLILFVFIISALFYFANKMGYIEITPTGKATLDTVFNDLLVAVKNFIASIFRTLADKIQGAVIAP